MRGISFDQKTDLQEAVKQLKGRVALIGYVPTSLLLEGLPMKSIFFPGNVSGQESMCSMQVVPGRPMSQTKM